MKFKIGDKVKFKNNWNTLAHWKHYKTFDLNKSYTIYLTGEYEFKDCINKNVIQIPEVYEGWIPEEVIELINESESKEEVSLEIKSIVEYQCSPIPENAIKIKVIKDIYKEDITAHGYLPDLIPKNSIMWIKPWVFIDRIKDKTSLEICPENNRFGANIPADYFEIIDDSKDFQFEVGKWYKVNWKDNPTPIYINPSFIDKTHIHCSGQSSIWESYGICENACYNIEKLEIIYELKNLSEIQQYLPDSHQDKLIVEENWIPQVGELKSKENSSKLDTKFKSTYISLPKIKIKSNKFKF